MGTILVHPKDPAELQFLSAVLAKMSIRTTVFSEEKWEDSGLSHLMKAADRNDRISRQSIMAQLRAA